MHQTPKLSLAKITLGAFLIPWVSRVRFFRETSPLILVQVMLTMAWTSSSDLLPAYGNWILYALHSALFVMVAVRSHRIMLLGSEHQSSLGLPSWTMRDTNFVAAILGGWIALMPVHFVSQILIGFPVMNWIATSEQRLPAYAAAVAALPAFYLAGRFVLALPAIAIDAPVKLGEFWVRTKSNGLRMLVVIGALPYAIAHLTNLLYVVEGSFYLDLAITLVSNILVIVEVAALSLAYKDLMGTKAESSPVQ